jgi:hypothetical protein
MKLRPCRCTCGSKCRPKNTLPSVLYTEGTEKVNQSVEEDLKKEDPDDVEAATAAIQDNEVDE